MAKNKIFKTVIQRRNGAKAQWCNCAALNVRGESKEPKELKSFNEK
jgi:hypothetical protein